MKTTLLILSVFSGLAMAEEPIHEQHQKHAFLGVTIGGFTELITDDGTIAGVRINSVIDDSAAEKAGLKKDDIILSVNDVALTNHKGLVSVLRDYKPGEEVTLKVNRDGENLTLNAELGESPTRRFAFRNKWLEVFDEDRAYFGTNLTDLNDQMAEYFGVDHGVLINKVIEESPAEAAGLKAGDVILSWNGQDVKKSGDVMKAIRNGDREAAVTVLVKRRDERLEFSVTPGSWGDYHSKTGDFHFDTNFEFAPHFRMKLEGLNGDGEEFSFDSMGEELGDLQENLHEMIEEGLDDQMKQLDDHFKILKKELKEVEKEPIHEKKKDTML
jgi:membrane-associated protease RseP (regulator of RpoE activity)